MLKHEDPVVLRLLRKLRDIGFEFSILGGYPRDVFYNKQPRDLDVCIYNIGTGTDSFIQIMNELTFFLADEGLFQSEHYSDQNPQYDDERIYCVIKTKLDVDLIFWGDAYCTQDSVLYEFDYNLNQFELRLNLDNGMNAMPVPHCENYGILTQLRGYDVPATRKERMEALAESYSWSNPTFNSFERS